MFHNHIFITIYFKYLKGLDCCSDSSISFHYMLENEIKRLSFILDYFKLIKLIDKPGIQIKFKDILDKFLIF